MLGAQDEPGVSPPVDIDQIKDILAQTVGSIKGSAGLVLWFWAHNSVLSFDWRTQPRSVWLAVAWLVTVAVVRTLMWANRRIVDAGKPWTPLAADRDVVLVTGGSSGLGLLVAAMFSSDGFRVVIFDVAEPHIRIGRATFVRVDVGDENAVAAAVDALSEPPSVAVCCAGVVAGSLGPLDTLDPASIRRVVETNLLGPVWTTQALLRRRAPLKMVVGVSSSTALVGPAGAAVYAASKAGVRTLFEALRHELTSTRVLYVTPGQLDTAMFAAVRTPSPFWAPVSRALDVATMLYAAIRAGREGEIAAPLYTRLLPYILVLPQGAVDILRSWIGVDDAVDLSAAAAGTAVEQKKSSIN